MADVQLPEARAAYGFQLMMENIHSEVYSLLIDTYIKEDREKNQLFQAIDNFPCIKKRLIGLLNGLKIKDQISLQGLLPSLVLRAFFSLDHFAVFTGLKNVG